MSPEERRRLWMMAFAAERTRHIDTTIGDAAWLADNALKLIDRRISEGKL